MIRYYPYKILNYLRISLKLFSFCLINPQLSCFVRKMSVKCSENLVMNLDIIGNTFVNIRKNSHRLHFHLSDWFQIVRDFWIYHYREQSESIFRQVGPGLNSNTSVCFVLNLILITDWQALTGRRDRWRRERCPVSGWLSWPWPWPSTRPRSSVCSQSRNRPASLPRRPSRTSSRHRTWTTGASEPDPRWPTSEKGSDPCMIRSGQLNSLSRAKCCNLIGWWSKNTAWSLLFEM